MTMALILSVVLLLLAWIWLRFAKREVSMPIWSTLEIPELAEDESPFVSIIVCTRNEAHHIARCVQSLLRQEYPRFEVVAVDGRSTDGTWERLLAIEAVAEGTLRVRRVDGALPERAWRLHAVQQGVDAARGDWLLFTAADTYHAPGLLSRAMAYNRLQGLGLLSLAPRQECRSFWEHTWQPLALQYLDWIMPMVRVSEPAARSVWASESFLLMSRDAYMNAGGHTHAASEAHPGSALMQRLKSLGYRVEFVKGLDLLQARTYRGFWELWSGGGEDLSALLGEHPLLVVAHALVLWAWTVLPFVALVPAFSFGFWGLDAVVGWWDVTLAVCAILAVVTILQAQSVVRRVHRQNHFYTATLPLGGFCLGASMIATAIRHLTRDEGLGEEECCADAKTLHSND